jgi:hypothetical protein
MNRCKKWATAGVVLALMGVLAGCGTTDNGTNPTSTANSAALSGNNDVTSNTVSNNTLTTSNSTTGTNHRDSFPSLIQHAMQEISSKTSITLYAPTTYPGAVHTPMPVTVQTSVSTAPVPHYSVLFNRNDPT